ncbi:MAG: DNA repair protein RecO [Spirochaetales bacterium]|nr:DNA repair protein RecO [Spirochaetales bacterium]
MASRNQIHQVIVLKSQAFGEIHRSLTLYSAEEGIIYATAHGTQKIKSKLRPFTEAFGRYKAYLYLNPVKNQYKLNDGEGLKAFHSGHESIEKFYTASLFCEMILKSFGGGTEHSQLYELIDQSLEILENMTENKRIYLLLQYLYRFLKINGFSLDLANCDSCSRKIAPEETLFYHHSQDGLFCSQCQSRFPADQLPLPPGARKYLDTTPALSLISALEISLEKNTALNLKMLLFSCIQGLLEGPLNSLKQSKEFI